MTTRKLHIGLPQDLAVKVLRAYGEDERSELPAIIKSTEASAEQIASHIARQALGREWRGRMSVQTRDRIKGMVEAYFTPTDTAPAIDPLAHMSEGFAAITGSSQIASELEPTIIRGAGPDVKITRVEEEEPQPASLIIEGGTPGADAA